MVQGSYDFWCFPTSYAILVFIICLSILAFIFKQVKLLLGLYPYLLIKDKAYYRLISSGFIHLHLLHFLLNILCFIIVAPRVEHMLGSFELAFIYLGSLLLSSGITTMQHQHDPTYNSLGASGPIAGILMSWIWCQPDLSLKIGNGIDIPAWLLGLAYLLYSYLSSIFSTSRINHRAHLWGGFSGVFFTIIIQYIHTSFK